MPRSQAMKLVGHKTESIYRRYAISNEADLREAVAKVAAQVAADKREPRKVVPIDASNNGTEPVPQADSGGAHAAEGSRK